MKKTTRTRKRNPAIERDKNGRKSLHKESAVEECYNNEVNKINQNVVDRISQLPDAILVSIISRLTFKEATATSILSTRWRHLYTHIISLDFRFPFKPEKFDLGEYDEEIQEEEFTDYISRINHTLDSYKGGNEVSKDFRLHMPCLAGADIENWLEFALSREVQIVDIHMVYCIKATQESNYTFPISTLISKNGSQAILPGLKCLKELSLTAVHVDDEDIELLLSYFVALECLSIESPGTWSFKMLENVSVVGHRKLKHLNMSRFWSVKSIEVRDMISLVSLSFYQLPPTCVLQLGDVPNLVEFNASDEKRNTLAEILPRISCIHDQLLRLKLCTFRDHIMLRIRIGSQKKRIMFQGLKPTYMLPKLMNLKHLELDVFMNNKCGTIELFPLIEACPSLEELEVKFMWPSEVKYIDRELNKCRVERECPNYNLRKVRLSRYSGSTPELEFALYIVNNAVALQELMIVEACDRTREIRRRAIAHACRRNSVSFIMM